MSDEPPDLLSVALGGPVGPGVLITRRALKALPTQRLLRKNRVLDRAIPAVLGRIRGTSHTTEYFRQLAPRLSEEVEHSSDLRAACDRKGGVDNVVSSLAELNEWAVPASLLALGGGTRAARSSMEVTGLSELMGVLSGSGTVIVIVPHVGPSSLAMVPVLAEGRSVATFHNADFGTVSTLNRAAAFLPFERSASLNSIRVPSLKSLILARRQMQSGSPLFFQPDAFELVTDDAEIIPCQLLGGAYPAFKALFVFQRLTRAEVFMASGRLQRAAARPLAVTYERVEDLPEDKLDFLHAVYGRLGRVLGDNIDQWRELGWWLDEIKRQRREAPQTA